MFTCEIWFPVSLLIYSSIAEKKCENTFHFLGGHNGDNARLDCPQLHQLGKFKFQNITFVKMFKSQYVPKSFVIKYNLPKYLFNSNLICRNIYDSIFLNCQIRDAKKFRTPGPTNFFRPLPLRRELFNDFELFAKRE